MKNLLLLSVILLASSCFSSKAISYNRTGQVSSTNTTKSTITLASSAFASSKEKAFEFALRNAFENLLFKGVPASNQELPLISNETEALEKHSQYFLDLLNMEGYQKFIMESSLDSIDKLNGGVSSEITVKIDLAAFRRDLEQNNITSKFGI